MTITTTAPAHTTPDVLTAIGAAPRFTAGQLDATAPSADLLAVLGDAYTWSGIQRGTAAAAALQRLVPAGVQVEECDLGAGRTTRGVFLHPGGPDHIALYFLDATAEVSVHIDNYADGENFDRFVPAAEVFDLVRAFYRS
jgi:hypothetical protein